MTFKKLSAAAIATLTTLALTACGGDTEAEEASPSTITETVTETVDHTTTVTETPEDQPAPTAAAAEEPDPEPESAVSFGPGTQMVGSDIQPGTYRNSDSSNLCYWERLSGHSGEMGDLIANGATENQAVVTIAATDAAFSSTDCGTWELVE